MKRHDNRFFFHLILIGSVAATIGVALSFGSPVGFASCLAILCIAFIAMLGDARRETIVYPSLIETKTVMGDEQPIVMTPTEAMLPTNVPVLPTAAMVITNTPVRIDAAMTN